MIFVYIGKTEREGKNQVRLLGLERDGSNTPETEKKE